MHRVESYVAGGWHRPAGDGRPLLDAATGQAVAELSPAGVDAADAVAYGRDTGGPALRELTFHQRASILRNVGKMLLADDAKEQLYDLSYCTGATRSDSWIDIEGGAGVLLSYASMARRELPNSTVAVDGATEALSRDDSFSAVHVLTSRKGVGAADQRLQLPGVGDAREARPRLHCRRAVHRQAGVAHLLPRRSDGAAHHRIRADARRIPAAAVRVTLGAGRSARLP